MDEREHQTLVENLLQDLYNRLFRADVELSRMEPQSERLAGKVEGVRLAMSYVEELLR